jgi:hypothetical protein
MKKKSLKLRLSYFFRQRKRIYSKDSSENMPALVKSERTDSVIEDILRWADEGGKMLPRTSQGTLGSGSGTGKHRINEGRS